MGKKNARMQTGRLGEDAACRHLIRLGHTILERNWRCGHLEIDIISMDRDGIHFVEVKTRRLPMQAAPEANVNRAKQQHLVAAAGRYLSSDAMRQHDCECFFDVVTVVFGGGETWIEYIPRAFIPVTFGL